MTHRLCLATIVMLCLATSRAVGQTPAAPPLAVYDEATLRQANFDTGAARLLILLHAHTRTDGDPKKIQALIEELGGPDFEQREHATQELIAAGRPALPALHAAHEKHIDPEIRLRAGRCLTALESLQDPNIAMSLVRRLIYLRANGAAENLLAFLPTADWEIQDEIFRGLPEVAQRDGQLDPALLAALEDKLPLRRAAAALAVALVGSDNDRLRVRKLLEDRDASVCLHAAQGLLAARDATSLPVLIALLNECNVELSWPAEELLHWVAGEQAPAAMVGAASAKEREKAVAAWTAWRQTHGQKINWEQVEQAPRRPGLYLACMDRNLWLVGCDGKRWTLGLPYTAHDALLLPGNQLLLVPYAAENQLVRCDLSGQELWQRPRIAADYAMCQRLPNGHWFLVSEQQIAEFTVEGREVSSTGMDKPQRSGDAWKLRNGEMRFYESKVLRLQKCAFLPDGRYVVADWKRNRVVERDSQDKPQRELPVHNPWSVEALPNGHYLVSTSSPTQRLVELDPAGRTLWELVTPDTVQRVRSVLGHVRFGFDKPRPPGFNLDTAAQRVRGLQHADPQMRRRAAALLGFLRPTDVASVQALGAALDDPSAEVRAEVRATLGMIGEPAGAALGHGLKKGSHQDRLATLRVLEQLGRDAKHAVPDLIEVLQAGQVERALRRATPVLNRFGPLTKHALPLLLAVAPTADEKDELCLKTIDVLYNIGPQARAAVPALLAVVRDGQRPETTRYAAAKTLSRAGPAAKLAVPGFGELLRDPQVSPHLAYALLDGLSKMGREGVVGLAQAASEGNAVTRCVALEMLLTQGEEARLALPAIENAMNDSDPKVREAAKQAQLLIVASIERNNPTLVR